jgi:pentatricopeptide repeat protein
MKTRFAALDVITWSAVIAATGHHGRGPEVLKIFEEMIASGVHPDKVTFLSVLNACSYLPEKALYYFKLMSKFGVSPSTNHYNSLIDVYGRVGKLAEAEDILNEMPEPDQISFMTLLGAARLAKHVELAKRTADKLQEKYPHLPATYALLGNTLMAPLRGSSLNGSVLSLLEWSLFM